MTTPVPSHSATIYQFRPRAPATARDVRPAKPATDQVQPAGLVTGGSWYHEAAIQAERANKP